MTVEIPTELMINEAVQAILGKNFQRLNYLLFMGLDPNARVASGRTILYCSIWKVDGSTFSNGDRKPDTRFFELCLQAGGDIYLKTKVPDDRGRMNSASLCTGDFINRCYSLRRSYYKNAYQKITGKIIDESLFPIYP